MSSNTKIFLTGTMRTGGSLLINLLSVHPDIVILNGRVHFFRFIHKRYEPLNPRNVERMIQYQKLRLRHRMNLELDVDAIFDRIAGSEITYPALYDAMMEYFLNKTPKTIWGEYSALAWRHVPHFLKFFPGAKVVHIYRNPAGVLSSWKKLSSIPNNAYLNAIFNWIDSTNYVSEYSETLPKDKYFPIKYEEIHADPERIVRSLCDFLEVEYVETLLHQDKWAELIAVNNRETNLVNIPRSAHEGNHVVGFSSTRSSNWQKHLERWEIALIELLAHDQLERFDYQLSDQAYSVKDIKKGIDVLSHNPLLLKQLNSLLATGQGNDQYPTDPTDPNNWGAPNNPSEWFTDSPAADLYFRELKEVEKQLSEKYTESSVTA